MPIQIMRMPGGGAPVIVCDFCGQRIEDAQEANYEWVEDGESDNSFTDCYLVHKKCCRSNEERVGRDLSSMEMNVLVPFLANNLNIDWAQASAHAKLMEGYGDPEYVEAFGKGFAKEEDLGL